MNEDERGIFSLGEYQPYWIYMNGEKIRNPKFNKITGGYILDVKNNKYEGIKYYTAELKEKLFKIEGILDFDPIITCVPSSKCGKVGEGLKKIIENICKEFELDNYCGYLYRDYDIPKLSSGGNRNISVHLNSISVLNKNKFKDRVVFILDDITTTGNSLKACEQLLLESGAIKVLLIALGKTVSTY